jgi:hypothetical protein
MTRATRARFGWVVLFVGLAIVGWSLALERGGPLRPLLRMHDEFVLAFIDSEGFGQRRLPAMSNVMSQPVADTPWFVSDLELIGVAKHNPPQVFGGGFSMDIFHRPNAEVPLARGSGRAMTAEEARALRELDTGKRLVVKNEGRGFLRVIGPIRAGDECLGCHQDKRAGDMLGAFVYQLSPMPKKQK